MTRTIKALNVVNRIQTILPSQPVSNQIRPRPNLYNKSDLILPFTTSSPSASRNEVPPRSLYHTPFSNKADLVPHAPFHVPHPLFKQIRGGKLSFLRRGDEGDHILRVPDAKRETRVFVFVHPDLLGSVGARSGLAGRVPWHRVARSHAVGRVPEFVARRIHVVVSART